jgi:hypothetical protein
MLDFKNLKLIWLSLIQAYIKMEAYGYAIADATKALELDPANVKVYIHCAFYQMLSYF